MSSVKDKSTDMTDELLNHDRVGRIPDAIEDLKAGKCIIVVDDFDRENEGDLICPAECVTPEIINFYETHVRGWICVSMAPSEVDRLELPMMVEMNTERHGTAFTVTVDYREGTSTGISAADQALTVQKLADPESKPHDFLRPGHVRPLRARAGGVLDRAGHTEAVVDLMKLSGYSPVGMLCEIKNSDGSMARLPDLIEYAKQHDFRIYTIKDLIAYRLSTEKLTKRIVETDVETCWGRFRAYGYESIVRDEQHLAFVYGDLGAIIAGPEPALVRVHHSNELCDIFGIRDKESFDHIDAAMKKIVENGSGVFVYIRSRHRGQRMISKLTEMSEAEEVVIKNGTASELPPEHAKRDYGMGAQILNDLGLRRIKVLTDHPREFVGLGGFAIELVGNVPLSGKPGQCFTR